MADMDHEQDETLDWDGHLAVLEVHDLLQEGLAQLHERVFDAAEQQRLVELLNSPDVRRSTELHERWTRSREDAA